jgi:AraC-like DNA-binding protein
METPALVSNNCPDSYAREALEEELFGLMADAYLYSRHEFASTASRIYRSGRIVRKAEECFMAAGGRPVSLADLCAAAGVSKSKLYLAFHNMCGESPLAYFHKRRLIRARSILLNATPARGAVKRAALSVGLTELGRFSVEYRRLFGEKPSTTLRNTD